MLIKNINKTVIAKIKKMSNIIYFYRKYNQTSGNNNIDLIKDIRLTNIKKY